MVLLEVIAAMLLASAYIYALFTRSERHAITSPENNSSTYTRLGKSDRSNLEDQYTALTEYKQARVHALFVYPVKSCRGVELSTSSVTGLGLRYDRLFSFAQLVSKRAPTQVSQEGKKSISTGIANEWRFLTQRECPKLALLETELYVPNLVNTSQNIGNWSASGGWLIIRFPYESGGILFGNRTETITLRIPLEPNSTVAASQKYTHERMTIWKDHPQSLNVSNSIDPSNITKLKHFLGISNPLNLFRVDNLNLRSVTRSLPKDRPDEKFKVGFADAFPVHLLSIASIRALDDSLPDDSEIKGKLDARRFRANIYISGTPAHAEDRWFRVNVGEAVNEPAQYHVACRTARCTLPNVHPDTGVKDRNEPHATMKRTRQVDEGAKPHPCLGLSMIPLFGKAEISVGDEIEILETGELIYEKMFP